MRLLVSPLHPSVRPVYQADAFRALADLTRRRIVEVLRNGDRQANNIVARAGSTSPRSCVNWARSRLPLGAAGRGAPALSPLQASSRS
jgi:hypothetical protein